MFRASTHRWVVSGLALSLALAGSLAGCSDDEDGAVADSDTGITSQIGDDTGGADGDAAGSQDVGPAPAVEVDTRASVSEVAAGTPLGVVCLATDAAGVEVSAEAANWSLQLVGDGATAEGLSVTATKAGTLTIACVLDDPALTDGTPLEIKVVAGPLASTVAAIDPAATIAGETATVTCTGADAWGNEATGTFTITVDPADGVSMAADRVISETVGEKTVTCGADGVSDDAQQPVTWTVTAAAPMELALAFQPDLPSYAINQVVTVTGVGTDSYGNALEGLELTDLAAAPGADATILEGGKIRFGVEALYTISGTAAAYPELSASRVLAVDRTPPVITITAPARGLIADGFTEVTVEGSVSDNLGELGPVFLNDVPLDLPPEGGAFSQTVTLGYGLNLLIVSAEDPYGNAAKAGRTAEHSGSWYPLVAPTVEADGVTRGIDIVLGQEVVDDGVHDPNELNDLATIMMVALSGTNFGDLVGNPLAAFNCGSADCELRMSDVSFTVSEISLGLMNGGIQVAFTLSDFTGEVTLDIPCTVPVICPSDPLGLPGSLDLETVTFTTDLALALATDGSVEASASNTEVTLAGLTLDIPDPTGILQGWIDQGVGFVEPALLGALGLLLPPVIESLVGDTLGQLLAVLSLEQDFEIPALVKGGEPNVIQLSTEPAELTTTPFFLRLSLNVLARALAPMPPRESPGSVDYTTCGPDLAVPTPPTSPLALGLHEDVLNQLLYAIWDGGTLSIDVGPGEELDFDLSGFGVTINSLTVDPLLPPVFNSCNAAAENRAQIGDMAVDADLVIFGQQAHLRLWLQAETALTMTTGTSDTGASQIGFELGAFDPIVIEIITNEGAFEGDDPAVIELFESTLLPLLFDSLADLNFEIPTIDLSALSETLPAEATLTPDLTAFGRAGAYLTVEGGLK